MLTIKHQTPYGNEALYIAKNVQFAPVENVRRDQPVGTSSGALGVVYYRDADDVLESLQDGMVYVMNPAGSTVGNYDLGGWTANAAA